MVDAMRLLLGSPATVGVQPRRFTLEQNYPNPFNATTTLPYSIDRAGAIALTLYDLRGREVYHMSRVHSGAGAYQIIWGGKDDRGLSLPSGLYIYRLQFHDQSQIRKLVLLK